MRNKKIIKEISKNKKNKKINPIKINKNNKQKTLILNKLKILYSLKKNIIRKISSF